MKTDRSWGAAAGFVSNDKVCLPCARRIAGRFATAPDDCDRRTETDTECFAWSPSTPLFVWPSGATRTYGCLCRIPPSTRVPTSVPYSRTAAGRTGTAHYMVCLRPQVAPGGRYVILTPAPPLPGRPCHTHRERANPSRPLYRSVKPYPASGPQHRHTTSTTPLRGAERCRTD